MSGRRRISTAAVIALAGATAGAPGLDAQEQGRLLEVDDLFQVRSVAAPRLSPDGGWVAYTVTTTSLEDEKSETRLWMVPFDGGDPLPMTSVGTSVRAPAWSPDGRYLSFTASRDDEPSQVWVLDRRGGEARALTDVEHGVTAYAWSPDGGRIALVMRDAEPEVEGTQPPWVIDRLQFKRDGRGYLDRRRTHLYVLDVEADELRKLTSGDFDHTAPAWSPDGRRLAFVANRTEEPDANANTDIWVLEADADTTVQPTRVTTNPGQDGSPTWSPDGRWIAYTTVVEPELICYATTHLGLIPSSGGEARVLTRELDRNVSNPMFTEDGRHVRFRLEDSAEDHLAQVPVGGGAVERLLDGPVSVRAYQQGSDGRAVAQDRFASLQYHRGIIDGKARQAFLGLGPRCRHGRVAA